jgi:hypothetical protein
MKKQGQWLLDRPVKPGDDNERKVRRKTKGPG